MMEMMRSLQEQVAALRGSVNGAHDLERSPPGVAAGVGQASREPSAPMEDPATELQVLPAAAGQPPATLPPVLHPSGTATPSAISNASSDVMQVVSLIAEGISRAPSLPCPKRPNFAGKTSQNPVIFLRDFEHFYVQVAHSRSDKLLEVQACLENEAKEWAEFKRDQWTSFEDFRRSVLDKYWSVGTQAAVRKELRGKPFDMKRDRSLSNFFIQRVSVLKTLTSVPPEDYLVDDVMATLPDRVWSKWENQDRYPKKIDDALKFLEREDRKHKSLQRPRDYGSQEGYRNQNGGNRSFARPAPHVNMAEALTAPLPDVSKPPPSPSGNGGRARSGGKRALW